MDLFEAIEKRHSYRGKFLDEPVPEEDLRKIVEAGYRAPSGCNFQTTHFVVVTEPDTVRKVAAVVRKDAIRTAKAVIALLSDREPCLRGMRFFVEDCAAAAENILLAITALGYATCWIDGALRREERAERIARLLQAPGDLQLRIILPLGKPAEALKPPEKKPLAERVFWERFARDG